MRARKGFTLIELMVVILIVGILAAVSIPLMRGRIDSAKWSEANAMAGTIRTAIRAYSAEKSVATAQGLVGDTLDTAATQSVLGFAATDLTGTYFSPECFTITAVSADGIATIDVDASQSTKANPPTGTYQLELDGDWTKTS